MSCKKKEQVDDKKRDSIMWRDLLFHVSYVQKNVPRLEWGWWNAWKKRFTKNMNTKTKVRKSFDFETSLMLKNFTAANAQFFCYLIALSVEETH